LPGFERELPDFGGFELPFLDFGPFDFNLGPEFDLSHFDRSWFALPAWLNHDFAAVRARRPPVRGQRTPA
jgi:hypothetical protein